MTLILFILTRFEEGFVNILSALHFLTKNAKNYNKYIFEENKNDTPG